MSDSSPSSASRTTTPPTPMTTHESDLADLERRRRQSDQASQEIGTLLLQGWALLGDDCPNPSCLGIPLMRPREDPRKFCVICRLYYSDQSQQQSQPQQPQQQQLQQQETQQEQQPSQESSSQEKPPKSSKRRYNDAALEQLRPRPANQVAMAPISSSATTVTTRTTANTDETSQSTWSRAAAALQQAAQRLTHQLEAYTANTTTPLDPQTVANIADALVKVSSAHSTLEQNL